jgi:hypothetical protein
MQAALRAFVALLDAWREQFGPREYEVLLDLIAGHLERELAEPKAAAKAVGRVRLARHKRWT